MMVSATDRSAFYALLHVPSGQLMRMHRWNRGYTQQEFPLRMELSEVPPRLFISERGAKQAASWWLKGETTKTTVALGYGEYDDEFTTKPRGDRKPGDMVIVKLRLFVEKVIE